MADRTILITGAAGYLGRQLSERLNRDERIVGLDIRTPEAAPAEFIEMDIRDPDLSTVMTERGVTHVVHLAAVLEGSGDRTRDHDIDVNGTRNVLEAAIHSGVQQLVVSSSGAAYGYHADNPEWLDENDALRGNPEFPYSDHKRLIEEMLARYRRDHPELKQLIFRSGTILGADTDNQITQLFEGRRILAISGSDSPFVFIWDQDVLGAMMHGIRTGTAGIYNLAGDGALTVDAVAGIVDKPLLRVPAWAVKTALRVGQPLGLTRHAPAEVNFLRYRPVLSNRRLKEELGYTPARTSEEVLRDFVAHARERHQI